MQNIDLWLPRNVRWEERDRKRAYKVYRESSVLKDMFISLIVVMVS
jgi:hypothetical protein